MKQVQQFDPAFNLRKKNNYNNGVKFASRTVLEQFDLDPSIKNVPPKSFVSIP
jgi:hypothetical protein